MRHIFCGMRTLPAVVMTLASLATCHRIPGMSGRGDGAGTADRLSTAVKDAVAQDRPGPIDLAQVTTFDWDAVWFFGPYSKPAQIERRLGFPWSGARKYQMDWRDDAVLVVFTRQREVVRSLAFPRVEGDLVGLGNQKLSRDQARLVASVKKSGWITLAAAP
jgi:hypothetical protein